MLGRGERARAPKTLNKSANYHVYFWFHGARFLEAEGYLAFITSGEWLDSDYGSTLQRWLLDNFKIEAFIETGAETWFSEARVGTVVTIAKECSNREEREGNMVRFVMLRSTLRSLVGLHDNARDQIAAVDRLRDRILGLTGHGEGDDMDWSAVLQSDLRGLSTG